MGKSAVYPLSVDMTPLIHKFVIFCLFSGGFLVGFMAAFDDWSQPRRAGLELVNRSMMEFYKRQA